MKNILSMAFILVFSSSVFAGGARMGSHQGHNAMSSGKSSSGVHFYGRMYVGYDDKQTGSAADVENLDDGLKSCDYLSLHVPLTEKTKNMIDYSKLKTMKNTAIIINTSRGGIINEADLDKAINEKIIFGAGLDVFEKEPVDKNNPLLKNNKVLLSPHSATFTNECKSRMSLETTKNIIDFFENKIDKSMIVKI